MKKISLFLVLVLSLSLILSSCAGYKKANEATVDDDGIKIEVGFNAVNKSADVVTLDLTITSTLDTVNDAIISITAYGDYQQLFSFGTLDTKLTHETMSEDVSLSKGTTTKEIYTKLAHIPDSTSGTLVISVTCDNSEVSENFPSKVSSSITLHYNIADRIFVLGESEKAANRALNSLPAKRLIKELDDFYGDLQI